ncbi:MAG: hypothetical protein RLZZ271_1353, partial [Pseudomonadota bacterium]
MGLGNGIRGMFNLNDGKWGRSDADSRPSASSDSQPDKQGGNDSGDQGGAQPPSPPQSPRPRSQGPQGGPPDLDELWRDFNSKLGGLFGGKPGSGPAWGKGGGTGGNNNEGGGNHSGGGFPGMKGA